MRTKTAAVSRVKIDALSRDAGGLRRLEGDIRQRQNLRRGSVTRARVAGLFNSWEPRSKGMPVVPFSSWLEGPDLLGGASLAPR